MLVIGSAALYTQTTSEQRDMFAIRRPNDLDFICTDDEMFRYATIHGLRIRQLSQYKCAGIKDDKPLCEFELLHESKSGRAYLDYINREYSGKPINGTCFLWDERGAFPMIPAPLEVLYSIKLSHRNYPRSWKKHIEDIMLLKQFLKEDRLADITAIREEETKERYGALKTPSLDKTAAEFFDDNVSNRLFVHDEIHQVMAYREKPMYEYYKKYPGTDKVACSREKFEALSIADRISGVLEEAYVIALERCLLPMLFDKGRPVTIQEAFDYAVMRICTTLTGGWFREFATMNYDKIMAYGNPGFLTKFLTAFEQGKISLINKETQ